MRGVTDVSGLREIRSLHTTGKRSIPGSQNSAYLDLYMLEKEKGRLEKEAALLEKRSQAIRKRLGEIQRQAESLKKSASQPEGRKGKDERGGEPSSPGKKWKTFSLNY
jgi:hypothetical protein